MANEAVPNDTIANRENSPENRRNEINLLACEKFGQRRFRSERGIVQNLRHCNANAPQNEAVRLPQPKIPVLPANPLP